MSWNDGLEVSSVAYQIASSSEKNIKVLAGPGTSKSFAMKRRVASFTRKSGRRWDGLL